MFQRWLHFQIKNGRRKSNFFSYININIMSLLEYSLKSSLIAQGITTLIGASGLFIIWRRKI